MEYQRSAVYRTVFSIILFIILILAFVGTMDKAGEDYTNAAFKRALITFGIARGINGVISVAQGTEVALHPAGFGVNFTPGQILDPINDLIEQFSWIMLASSASLGIQKMLLGISSSMAISVLLAILVLAVMVLQWRPDLVSKNIGRFLTSFAIILIFIRFSVPLTAVAGEGLYQFYLKDQYTESTEQLENAQKAISEISAENTQNIDIDSKEGLLDKAKKFFESASRNFSFDKRFEQYKDSAALATEHAINLIVVFLIQTVFFPLLFLWVIYRGLKQTWRGLLPT